MLGTDAACISHMSLHALLVCIAVICVAPIAVVRIPGASAAAAIIHLESLGQPASQQHHESSAQQCGCQHLNPIPTPCAGSIVLELRDARQHSCGCRQGHDP